MAARSPRQPAEKNLVDAWHSTYESAAASSSGNSELRDNDADVATAATRCAPAPACRTALRRLPRAGRLHPAKAGFGVGEWEPMDQRIDLVSQPHIGMIDMLIVAQRADRLMQSNGIGDELGGTPTHSRMPKSHACRPMPGELGGSSN